jgi:hypothetical protein
VGTARRHEPGAALAAAGQHQAAYQLLAAVYGGFIEGFDTADLREARVLLEALT